MRLRLGWRFSKRKTSFRVFYFCFLFMGALSFALWIAKPPLSLERGASAPLRRLMRIAKPP